MNDSASNPQEISFEEAKRRRRKSRIGVGLVLLGSIALIGAFSLLKSKPEPKEPEELAAPAVETLDIVPQTRNIRVNSQGSVSAVRDIKLISEVAGRVVEVAPSYADGGFFDAEQTIVQIDERDYHLALKQANAEVAKAQEVLAMEKGRARQAQREWRDIGDKEANTLFLREPQLASAEASLAGAEAARDKAKLNLSRTRITAPFKGRIGKKLVDVGQYVSPGTVIAEVYSTESVQIRLPLTDRQVAHVNLPLTAKPTHPLPDVGISSIHGGKTYHWRGKIVRTEGTLDPKSRVIFAVAEVEDPYAAENTVDKPPLSVGMYVSAEIIGSEVEQVVSLPRSVLRKKDEVTVVDAEDKIRFAKVDVLQNIGDEIIVSGLKNGDRVLLTRVPFAVAGLKVNPAPDPSLPEPNVNEEVIADAPPTIPNPKQKSSAQATTASEG